MSIEVGRYTFEGPYSSATYLEDRSGVYAIHCSLDAKYFLIDVGESAPLKSRVENHERAECWRRNCQGTFTVSAHYTPNLQQAGRMAIEQEIRAQFNPACGQR